MRLQSPLNQINPSDYIVLVAYEMEDGLEFVTTYLSGIGIRILTARTGESLLQQAQDAQPDLILLDLVMPNIDGFELCLRLKGDEQTEQIPIIFMTDSHETEHKVKGFQVGGVDYISKPVQVEELHARVMTHLCLRDLTQNLTEQALILKSTSQELSQTLEDLNETQAMLIETVKIKDDFNAALQKSNRELEVRVTKRTLELEEAKESAEVANRAKSVFLAQISHQLRTPLNAILGFTQIVLNDRETTLKQKDRLTIVYENGVDLLNLLNKIIQVTEMEMNRKPQIKDNVLMNNHVDLSTILEEHHRLQYAVATHSESKINPLPKIEKFKQWLEQLEQAVILLDMDKIFALTKEVTDSYPDLSKTLQYWANDFEYHKILKWIEDVKRQENIK